jgi:hypothetical protein
MVDVAKETADLVQADAHIAAGERRVRQQRLLVARLPDGSREQRAGNALLAALQRSLEAWRMHRDQILHLLDPVEYRLRSREPPAKVDDQAASRGIWGLMPDARRWRLKAEELQAAASGIEDRRARATFSRLADDYALLADRAAQRAGRERRLKNSLAK